MQYAFNSFDERAREKLENKILELKERVAEGEPLYCRIMDAMDSMARQARRNLKEYRTQVEAIGIDSPYWRELREKAEKEGLERAKQEGKEKDFLILFMYEDEAREKYPELKAREMMLEELIAEDVKENSGKKWPELSKKLAEKYNENPDYIIQVLMAVEVLSNPGPDMPDLYKLLLKIDEERKKNPGLTNRQIAEKFEHNGEIYADFVISHEKTIRKVPEVEKENLWHVDETNIELYLEDKLSEERVEDFISHVSDCEKCIENLAKYLIRKEMDEEED